MKIGRIPKDWPEERKERLKRRIEEYQRNQSTSTTQAQEPSKEKKERKKLITTMAYEATQQELRPKDWILDSDTNAHYCNDISLFVEYTECHNQSHNQGIHIADRLAPDLSI